jgi:Outer membrane protein beta-barrel domain
MTRRWMLRIVLVAMLACVGTTADAQEIGFRGFADVGGVRFAAADTFKAVLGTQTGVVYGGGVEAIFASNYFVNLHASRFQKDGTRVFVLNDQVFDLGIPTTIRITPIEVSGGYRFRVGRRTVVPYVGGGVGWYRYSEESDFAAAGEDVNETNIGYHLLGGAEVRLSRLFGVAGEVQWATVPDALGQDANSASAAFDETNLGGVTFRIKIVVGR